MIPWGGFPFNDELKKMAEGMKSGNVQSYVDEMMKKFTLTQFGDSSMGEKPLDSVEQAEQKTHVFETFDFVYIRLEIQNDVSLDQLRIFHTSNQAIIENLYGEERRKVIILPCLVKKKGATAHVKDNILEIRMPKSDDLQFTEISISERF